MGRHRAEKEKTTNDTWRQRTRVPKQESQELLSDTEKEEPSSEREPGD